MPAWVPRALLMGVGFALGTIAIYWLIGELEHLLVLLLMSLFVSFAIEPAVNWLDDHGWNRSLATLSVFVGVLAAGAVFTAAMASVVANQITTLIDAVPGYLEDLEEWVLDTFDYELDTSELASQFTEGGTAGSVLGSVATNLLDVGGRVLGILLDVFTVGLFTFYLVADGPRLRRAICSVLAARRQAVVLRGWEIAIEKTGGFIYSRTALAVISAVFHGIVFWIVGVPFPAPMALWVGIVSQFLPVIGTYLAGLLPALVTLLDNPPTVLWVIGTILVYQQIENYLLSPYLTARTMEIHAAVAFGSVLVGTAVLGGAGALLAVPAAATIQAFVSTYAKRHELIESELFGDDEDEDETADDEAAEDDDEPSVGRPAASGRAESD